MNTPLFDPTLAKDRLLAEAARLFRQNGYAKTTVRDLATALGLQSGSLFHHVRSKDDILFGVMDRVIAAMTRDLRSALDAAPDARARLRALIAVELAYLHGPGADATAVLFHDWRALPAERQAILLDGRNGYFGLWHAALSEAKDLGLVSIEPELLRQFLHGALAWTSFWYDPKGALDLDTMTDKALEMILR